MTSIPPTSAVPPTGTGPSTPAAPATGSTAVLTELPAAVRAAVPGSVITGTVLGRDPQGQTLLQTDSGVIGLRTAAQLAVGSQITLQIQAAGSQLQAVLLSAIAPKPGSATSAATARPAAPPPGAGAGAAAAPATTLAVSSGPVLTATVISPTTGGPIPNLPPIATSAAPVPPATTSPPTSPAAPGAVAPNRAPGATAPAPASPAAAAAGAASPPVQGTTLPTGPLIAQSVQAAAPSISSAAATYAATSGTAPSSSPTAVPGAPVSPRPSPAAATPAAAAPSPLPTAGQPPATSPAPNTTSPSPLPSTSAPLPATTASPAVQPAAAGTAVQLRLVGPVPSPQQPSTPATANQLTGTVVGYAPGGQAVVDTQLGRLALPLPPGADHPKAGTSVLFELLGLGTRAPAAGSSAAMPALGREWPTLKSAMTALADVDLPLARQILEINMPRLGSPRFLGQVLQYLTSRTTAEPRTLLGDTAVLTLERAGRGDILARLDAELREMNRLNASASDWRVFYVPILDVNELRQLRIFTRKKKSGRDRDRDGGRFIVEVDFDEFGEMQIDGLVQKPRIDVILRSHVELPPGMQAGIAEVFGRTCDASGLVGKIFFHATTSFPVSPLDEIAKAGPGLSV